MVKKAKWLENVKKAFSPDVKKLKHQSDEESVISYPVLVTRSRSSPPQFEVRVDEVHYQHKKKNDPSPPPSEEEDFKDALEDSPPSSPEFVPPPAAPDRFAGKSKEDAAAIFIQSTFRGHLARQESERLARLKSFMEGSVVQRHALKSMQTLTRVQSQIRSRRIRMVQENHARHKQLLQKHAKELRCSKNGGNKYEATMRRERGLAYASTHQQNLKSNLKPANTMFMMEPNNLTWGWSWSERLMVDQSWESSEKEQSSTAKPSVKTITNRNSHVGEATNSSNRKKLSSSSTQQNTSSTSSSSSSSTNLRKNKPTPPSIRPKTTEATAKSSEKNRRSITARSSVSDDEGLVSSTSRRHNMIPTKPSDEIAKSSEKSRGRQSTARSSVSDDEGLASSVARRRNMVPTTKPARGKLKAQSSSGVVAAATTEERNGVSQEKAPAAKKRASPAPKPRRASATPKVENSVLKAVKTPCA